MRPVDRVETPEALQALASELQGVPRLTLDTETNGLYSYRGPVCVVQIGLEARDVVIDPLAPALRASGLGALKAVLEAERPELLMHGASHDVGTLKRDAGIALRGIFDTHAVAQLLGRESVGLAGVLAHELGLQLDKSLQTWDWAKRPITDEQLRYLCNDVSHLAQVVERYSAELTARDLWEEAREEFRAVEATEASPDGHDALSVLRAKGADGLDRTQRAVLASLGRARDAAARALDRAPYRVVGDAQLLRLARERPASRAALAQNNALPGWLVRQFGDAFAAALAAPDHAAVEALEAEAARARRERPSQEEHERRRAAESALRAWRREKAEARGVTELAVLPGSTLRELATWLGRGALRDVGALAELRRFGARRAELYGAELVALAGQIGTSVGKR